MKNIILSDVAELIKVAKEAFEELQVRDFNGNITVEYLEKMFTDIRNKELTGEKMQALGYNDIIVMHYVLRAKGVNFYFQRHEIQVDNMDDWKEFVKTYIRHYTRLL